MKATEEIDRIFFDKKFNAAKYMLRYIVGASDDVRKDQLETITRFRSLADNEIAGVVDTNYSNFNASLGKFNVISNQLQEARSGLIEVSKRSMEGKAILTGKTKDLNDLLLLKYESKKVIEVVDDIDYIDKAPIKIRTALMEKNSILAVDIYLRAFELVLGEKLAVFHAISTMRNALMECKQLIEEYLVEELESILYLEDVFTTFSKGFHQSVVDFQRFLKHDTQYDIAIENFKDKNGTSNPLEELIQGVKRLSREVDVAGTLKNTREAHLVTVLKSVTSICKGKAFYEESKFGRHSASSTFQGYANVMCQVFTKLIQRHYLMVSYMNHSSSSMGEIVEQMFQLIQNEFLEYFGDSTNDMAEPMIIGATPETFNGLFRFAQLDSIPNQIEHEIPSKERVCPPSLFHLPVIYNDVVEFSRTLEPLCSTSFLKTIFHSYVTKQWIPKLKANAEAFYTRPNVRVPRKFDLHVPLDTNYNPPDVHLLMYIVDELFSIMNSLEPFRQDIAAIIEQLLLRYMEECSTIVRKICEGSLNQMETGVAATELMRSFQDYEVYITAKGNVPHQPLAKVLPSESIDTSHDTQSTPSHGYSVSYSLPEPILTTSTSTPIPLKSKKDEIHLKEWNFEVKFRDPNFWSTPNASKGLIFDQGKLSMLASINMACDALTIYIGSYIENNPIMENILNKIKSVSWRCSNLADECLFFLRREIRLHGYYYLIQMSNFNYNILNNENKNEINNSILLWNNYLLNLKLYLNNKKIRFLYDGIERYEAMICMNIILYIPKITIMGINQMQFNIYTLKQNLTGLYYGYPIIKYDFYYFEQAKKFFQLLTMTEIELELYLMENRHAFPLELLKLIWRIDVPTRILTKSSINKLDSLLR